MTAGAAIKMDLAFQQGRLRPASAEDLDALLGLLHDAGVRRYLCDDTLLPRKTVAEMLSRSQQLASRGLGLWMIERSTADPIGVAGLQPVSAELEAVPGMAGGIEPIIALHRKHWGEGLAGQAMRALIGHARNSLGLAQLVAAVDEPNIRSHRLMARCGFAPIGRAPGPAHELALYGLELTEDGAPI